jgi:hypothetical protein
MAKFMQNPRAPGQAADIETDRARTDNAVVDIKRRDTTDRESVSPMNVGHRQSPPDNAWKRCGVRYLLESLLLSNLAKHLFVCVDQARHSHPRFVGRRYFPAIVIDLAEDVGPRSGHRFLLP